MGIVSEMAGTVREMNTKVEMLREEDGRATGRRRERRRHIEVPGVGRESRRTMGIEINADV